MPFHWTGTTAFVLRSDRHPIGGINPTLVTSTGAHSGDENMAEQDNPTAEPEYTGDNTTMNQQITATPATNLDMEEIEGEPTNTGEPEPPPSTYGIPTPHDSTAVHYDGGLIPPHQQALYAPATPTENFQDQRNRFDRQETLPFHSNVHGPPSRYGSTTSRTTTTQGSTPYARPRPTDLAKAGTLTLPPGWTREDGFLTLDDCKDKWILCQDKFVRRHYLSRSKLFDPSDPTANCPVPLHYLSKDRQITGTNGMSKYDRWKQQRDKDTQGTWTGRTAFKIYPAYRLLAREDFL